MALDEQQQFKRNVAFKIRVGDIQAGKPMFDNDKFLFLELGNRKISRINIIGNIIDRYDKETENKYTILMLDDGSGQIKLRVFGEDVPKFQSVMQGQTVVVIGVIRSFNNELYIIPEIIKESDTRYLLIRKLELEKERNTTSQNMPKQQIVAVKDKILDKIRNAEGAGGAETEIIIMELRDASPEIINQEIKKLLEEGIIFEPRPGKLRYLG